MVAFANTDGGYIVLGVREVTDGSAPERYNPEGLSAAACNGLDVAKLGQQVESFMAERTNTQLQIHSLPEVENKQFALIYVPPSPHKPVIMQERGLVLQPASNGATRSPDVAWIRNDGWDALSDKEQHLFAPSCPHFVIELRSRTDPLNYVRAKMVEYIENGALLGWLIDPLTRQSTSTAPISMSNF